MTSLAQCRFSSFELEHLQDLDGVADRGQRVAQLVGEHRQELVLAAVVLLDVAVEPGVVDGDGGAAGQVFGQREVVRSVVPAGLADGQRERAEHAPAPRSGTAMADRSSKPARGCVAAARGS